MHMLRIVPIALVLGLLSGCATTKPELSSEGYDQFSKLWVGVHFCNNKGWMSPDVAARGKNIATGKLNQYLYDLARVEREIFSIESGNTLPTQGDCNNLAMSIQSASQQIAVNNQNAASEQRATQDLINSTRIKNTYCNRIGISTFCNTY